MNFVLNSKMSPGAGLRKALLRLTRRAIRDIKTISDNPSAKVHRLRTDMKKVRSILRLVKKHFSPQEFNAAWEAASGVKDALARARDAAVRHALEKTSLSKKQIKATAADLKPTKSERRAAGRYACKLAAALEAMHLQHLTIADLSSGLERTYNRGMRAMTVAAAASGSSEALHDWRKRVKDLWYQSSWLKLVDASAPKWCAPARNLSELLGKEHDMDVLWLKSANQDLVAKRSKKRNQLRRKIFRLGRELYSSDRLSHEHGD